MPVLYLTQNQFKMKKIFFILAFTAIAFIQNGFAQDSSKPEPFLILNTYFKIKDALVSSDSKLAATAAVMLAEAINGASAQTIKENVRTALLKDAAAISQANDIKVQREKFATLSGNMLELAKTAKLSADPVYHQYCPMKKASWLSNVQLIKNPYYGSAMLTCGTVKATL